nr:TatD family hydrolase [uncultured Friedmanniella sp.]
MDLPPSPEPLPHAVVDTHCHLDATAGFSGLSPAEALARAAAVGVPRLVQVGCDVASSRWAVDVAATFDGVVAAVALHPNDAARLGADLDAGLEAVAALAGRPQVRAVGETGLDFFRTPDGEGQAAQRQAFAAHIALAREHDHTLVIHDRDAHAAVLDVLDAEGLPERIVMHCFSGDADFARACLDRGAYLSFAGPVTFKPNVHLREALAVTPLDRLLTETDAPYLTPMPLRGRPNASYLLPHTVRFLAQTLAVDLTELCRRLDRNAETAFGGAW